MAAEERKVVATITPATTEPAPTVGQLQETWSELVIVKARLAEALNDVRILERRVDESERYVQRTVKRIDAVAGRLQRALAGQPRIRG